VAHIGDKKIAYGVMGIPDRRKDYWEDVNISGILILILNGSETNSVGTPSSS
jgi:hypothetical protein